MLNYSFNFIPRLDSILPEIKKIDLYKKNFDEIFGVKEEEKEEEKETDDKEE